jgi:tetratricopeptide (TPR) repeat protein
MTPLQAGRERAPFLSTLKLACALGLTLLAALPAAPDSGGLTPQEIAERVGDAVVLIEARSVGRLGQGSGFVLEGGTIVTCLHVIDGAERLAVVLRDGTRSEEVFVNAFDVENDLAVLVADELAEPLLRTTMPVGDATTMERGSPIVTISHPLGLEHTVTEGIVSSWREPPEEDSRDDGRQPQLVLPSIRLLQISATISPGSSGGPVLNDRAEVVGVATSGVLWGSVGLNFAVPTDALVPLLDRNEALDLVTFRERVDDARRELARPIYEDARMDYELDDAPKAGRKLERALKLFPRYVEALVLAGEIALEAGRIDVAEERFRLATEVDEYGVDGWFGLGEALRLQAIEHGSKSEFSGAEAAYSRALEFDDRHARAAYRLAEIQLVRGYHDRAEALLESALDNAPYLADAHALLGQILIESRRFDQAMESFEEALRGDPDHSMSHFGLALLHMREEIAAFNAPSPHGRSADHWREFLRLSEGKPELMEQREAALVQIREYYPFLLN